MFAIHIVNIFVKPKMVDMPLSQAYQSTCTAQSAEAVEYIDCTYAEEEEPPTSVLDIAQKKKSDGEVPVMLELWGILGAPSLPLLTGPLWPVVVAPDRAL